MITTTQEYFANLHLLQNVNPPVYAILPAAEKIYNIDLNSRRIEAPKFLSIEKDHKSETLYFCIDRYADYMDLAQTSCVIQYNNTQNQTRYYPVPFYDIYTKAEEKKILFPWCIDASVADKPGTVSFAIKFFKIGEILNDRNEAEKVLIYNLNTLPASSKVLQGIKEYKIQDDDYFLKPNQAEILQTKIDELAKSNILYWTYLDDSSIIK